MPRSTSPARPARLAKMTQDLRASRTRWRTVAAARHGRATFRPVTGRCCSRFLPTRLPLHRKPGPAAGDPRSLAPPPAEGAPPPRCRPRAPRRLRSRPFPRRPGSALTPARLDLQMAQLSEEMPEVLHSRPRWRRCAAAEHRASSPAHFGAAARRDPGRDRWADRPRSSRRPGDAGREGRPPRRGSGRR